MNRIEVLERQIGEIKNKLVALGDLQPGALSVQYNICGKAGCRCKADPPQKHGPYHQISYTRKGKGSSRFVKKQDVPAVRAQLKTYAMLRRLVDEWIDRATELANLRLAQRNGS